MAQLVPMESLDERPLVTLEGDFSKLTIRDKNILLDIAKGKKYVDICRKYGCKLHTVRKLFSREDARTFVRELTAGADMQLEVLYLKSVDAIRDTLVNGNYDQKIKAARLQMEATKRIGSGTILAADPVDANERLAKLAEKLLLLRDNSTRIIQTRRTEHGYEAQRETGFDSAAQADGDGQRDGSGDTTA